MVYLPDSAPVADAVCAADDAGIWERSNRRRSPRTSPTLDALDSRERRAAQLSRLRPAEQGALARERAQRPERFGRAEPPERLDRLDSRPVLPVASALAARDLLERGYRTLTRRAGR